MEKYKNAETYIKALKRQLIYSIIKERNEFKDFSHDDSPKKHFLMLCSMLNSILDDSTNILAQSRKIYEFTLFTPQYDEDDLYTFLTDEKVSLLYKSFQKDKQSKIFGYHALFQLLLSQKKHVALNLLKKILIVTGDENNKLTIGNDQPNNTLISLANFYKKLENMKSLLQSPQEITNCISDIIKFLESYQIGRNSSHLPTLPIYFFFNIVKFISKVLNNYPESNPSSLIRLLSLQPIILISYQFPNDFKFNEKVYIGLTPLSIFQVFLPNEFPQFLIPYYYNVFFSVFEFFVLFAIKPKPSNDYKDIQTILNTFKLISRYEAAKDAFLLCVSFFLKSNIHSYVLFRLYQYLEMKEKSTIHDYCVMIFVIGLDCLYLPHTRNILKSKHRVYLLKVLSTIEKNYEKSPFTDKVAFIKKTLIGEYVLNKDYSILQKYRLILSSNDYEVKQEKIYQILQQSIMYLHDPEVYTQFCLLIINTIQKITSKTNSADHFISYLSLFVYSHDFINLPKFHYIHALKVYSLLCLSNTVSTFRSLFAIQCFKNPSYFAGISIVFSHFHPISNYQSHQLSSRLNKIAIIIANRLIRSELPHFLFLLNDVLTVEIRHYNLTFDTIINFLITINNNNASLPFISRHSIRLLAAVSAVEGFDKFISTFSQINYLLEVIKTIGDKNCNSIPAAPAYINLWRIIGQKQNKNELLIASIIAMSHRVSRTRFFYESLFDVIINIPPILSILKITEWQRTPIFMRMIKSLPIDLKQFPVLAKIKEQSETKEEALIDIFRVKHFKLLPVAALMDGITGYYFNNKTDPV